MVLQHLPQLHNINFRWAIPILGGIGLTGGIQICYTAYHNATRYSRILNTFAKGSSISVEYVDIRSQEEMREAKEAILPHDSHKKYSIVTGQCGLGKSVLVHYLTYHIPGVLVVDVPITGDIVALGHDLANAIGFSFDEDHSIISKVLSFVGIDCPTARAPEKEESVLVCCLQALRKAAEINKSKGKPPLVLILDDVNQINDDHVIELLQRAAKFHADKGDLVFVFVMSEGRILRKMSEEGDPARFRIYEVLEITKASAREYVSSKIVHRLSDEQFERLYEATGGKIVDLVNVVDALKAPIINVDQVISKIRHDLINNAAAAFSHAGMLVPDQHKHGWSAVRAILAVDTQDISIVQFVEAVGGAELANQLLSKNVFAHHHTSNRVSMQSAAHVLFAKGIRD